MGKLPKDTAKNASKLHKRVGELLVELFPVMNIQQECCVSEVNKNFKSNREKFDWVIFDLQIVIEVHGEQHYTYVCFGGEQKFNAKQKFSKQVHSDIKKQKAVEDIGWAYVEVKYTEKKISKEELLDKIDAALKAIEPVEEEEKPKPKSRLGQKPKGGYKWPKRKLQSRGFQKKK